MKLKDDVTFTTSDFWYDVFEGGYINPSNYLANADDIKAVQDATNILEEFKDSLEPIMEEM